MMSLDYWRTQAAKASERERKALELAAEYQAKYEAKQAELLILKTKLINILK